jgi:hypothetical protein
MFHRVAGGKEKKRLLVEKTSPGYYFSVGSVKRIKWKRGNLCLVAQL